MTPYRNTERNPGKLWSLQGALINPAVFHDDAEFLLRAIDDTTRVVSPRGYCQHWQLAAFSSLRQHEYQHEEREYPFGREVCSFNPEPVIFVLHLNEGVYGSLCPAFDAN
jgi:hypothetical protein